MSIEPPTDAGHATLRRPVISHILGQHAEEAAFYWLRRQEALWRPSYRCSHQQRLDQLLDAHLEGLRVAAPAALPIVLDNLQRWKTPDEVFASTYTLLHGGAVDWSPLERVLEAQPSSASGAAAALIWSPGPEAQACMQRWSESAIPALRAAAAAAYAVLHANDSPAARGAWLEKTLSDPASQVHARALRCIGEWRLPELAENIYKAWTGKDTLCRFESAYAMAWLGLAQADAAMLETLPHMQGNRQRRAALLFALTAQPEAFTTWVQQAQADPVQSRLLIWSLAFRGDAFALTKLLEYLYMPHLTQLAAYAICHVTGLDLDKEGLWRPEEQNDPQAPHYSEDDGLLVADTAPLVDWVQRYIASMPRGSRRLAGKDMSPENAQPLLLSGWQPQRWQAAFVLDMHDHRHIYLSQVPTPLL